MELSTGKNRDGFVMGMDCVFKFYFSGVIKYTLFGKVLKVFPLIWFDGFLFAIFWLLPYLLHHNFWFKVNTHTLYIVMKITLCVNNKDNPNSTHWAFKGIHFTSIQKYTHTLCSGMMSFLDSLSPVTGSVMSFLINFSTHSWVTTVPLNIGKKKVSVDT